MTGERTPSGNIDSADNDKRDQKANHSRPQVLLPRHPSGDPFNCTKHRNEEKKNRKQHGFCAINGNPHNDNIPPQLPSEPRRQQNRKHQDKQKDRGMSKPPNSPLGNYSAHIPIEDCPGFQEKYDKRILRKTALVKSPSSKDSTIVILQKYISINVWTT